MWIRRQVTYNFSANLSGFGKSPDGTWTGFLRFDWLTPGGSGSGAAASFVTTSTPAGVVATTSEGWDATKWSSVARNSFTVVNGIVTSFQFGAITESDSIIICMNSGGPFVLPPRNLNCIENYNRVGEFIGVQPANFKGFDGVTFTPQSTVPGTTVPEPTSFAMFGAGLASVGFVRWRRRRNSKP